MRLTAKHGGVDGLGDGRAIAWNATDASLDDTVDDTVDGIFDVGVLAVRVLGVLVVVERRQRGLDWGLTTKHVGGTVVVVVDSCGGGRAIAWKAIDASLDDTVDDTVAVDVSLVFKSNLRKRASTTSNC